MSRHEPFAAALLRNPTRAKILAMLERNPGMNKNQLTKSLNVHENAIGFHLDRLAKCCLVEKRPGEDGREVLLFTAENVALWEKPETRILFGRGPPRQVALYFAEHPGTSSQTAAEALGLSVNTVRRHIRTLEEHGLVERLRVDRKVIYRAQPELMAWIEVAGKEHKRGLP